MSDEAKTNDLGPTMHPDEVLGRAILGKLATLPNPPRVEVTDDKASAFINAWSLGEAVRMVTGVEALRAERDALAAEVARFKAEAEKQAPPARTVSDLAMLFSDKVSEAKLSGRTLRLLTAAWDSAGLAEYEMLAKEAIAHLSAPRVVEPLTEGEGLVLAKAWVSNHPRYESVEAFAVALLPLVGAVANAQRAKARPVDVAAVRRAVFDEVLAALNPRWQDAETMHAREALYSFYETVQDMKEESAPPRPAQGEGAPLVSSATVIPNWNQRDVRVRIEGASPPTATIFCRDEAQARELARVLTAARMPAQKGGET